MVNFAVNIFLLLVVFLGILWVLRNRKAILNYRLQQWQEEATKLGNHAVSGLIPFVDGLPGLTADQRLDLQAVIREKLRVYRAGFQGDQPPKISTPPPVV